ncbi:MAG: energy transducer TonB [Myxococcota bacterium]
MMGLRPILYAGLLSLSLHALLLGLLLFLPSNAEQVTYTPVPLRLELVDDLVRELPPTFEPLAPTPPPLQTPHARAPRARVDAREVNGSPDITPVAPAHEVETASTPPVASGELLPPQPDTAPAPAREGTPSLQLDPALAFGSAGYAGVGGGTGAGETGAGGTTTSGPGTSADGAAGAGKGPLSEAEVRVQLQQLGRETRGRDKVSRGLYSKTLINYTTQMEARWEVRQEQVDHYPIRPQVRSGLRAANGVQDSRPSWSRGDDLSTPCYFERYSLGQVRLVLNAQGGVQEVSLYRSSGSIRLDREALRLVRGAAPYPAPEAQDVGPDGLCRMVWDVGVRNYSNSNCKPLDRKYLIKDIELVMVE